MIHRLRIALVFLLAVAATPASAATYSVDLWNDDPSKDGCLLFVPADCSLRGAVLKANANPGTDTIQLGRNVEYILTIVGSSENAAQTGDLDLTEDVYVVGRGAGISTVWQMATDRVFEVHPGVVAFFQLLTVRGGNETYGGGGGGIFNHGDATVLQRVEIYDNETTGSGGGIFSSDSALWLQQTSIRSNHASLSGGGIHLTGASGSALTIEESSIVANSTDQSTGGALFASNTDALIRNSTLSANESLAGTSPIDGIYLSSSTLTLESCTLVGDDPLLKPFNSTITLRSTLIVGACAYYDSTTSAILPDRGNVESPGDTCDLDDYTDLHDVADPELGILRQYGGHTWAHRPYVTSPAVDYLYATQRCQPDDQRGVSRPQPITDWLPYRCDAGAVELAPDELFFHGFDFGTWAGWSSWSY